eukprot:CAMPEP_0185727488 /NCGR_PEP_ID=MMETSP1171-20130828/3162_1 /TAXON_ID=374046 /ORGANISM="Helicotheca tamensis, Strain CCMP826" /LENGTH=92 /DNA_ID=CAMNT_0028396067 /DNA_START=657 /DNA_END=935 /DNA_ORIENTATION=+
MDAIAGVHPGNAKASSVVLRTDAVVLVTVEDKGDVLPNGSVIASGVVLAMTSASMQKGVHRLEEKGRKNLSGWWFGYLAILRRVLWYHSRMS